MHKYVHISKSEAPNDKINIFVTLFDRYSYSEIVNKEEFDQFKDDMREALEELCSII